MYDYMKKKGVSRKGRKTYIIILLLQSATPLASRFLCRKVKDSRRSTK